MKYDCIISIIRGKINKGTPINLNGLSKPG
jgi:hypothetical protein